MESGFSGPVSSPSNLTHCVTVPETLTASRCSVLFIFALYLAITLPPVLDLGSPVSSGSWCRSSREQYFWGTGPARTPRLRLSRRSRVKKLLAVLIVGSWLLSGTASRAQTPAQKESTTHVINNQDMDLLRKDLRSQRKQLIAANLKLTDTEAAKFWPVYDQYIAELITINDRKFGLIQEYADNWGKLTNEQSLLFTRNWLDMDIAIAQLRQKCRWWPRFWKEARPQLFSN
jgi:hypothetical protein